MSILLRKEDVAMRPETDFSPLLRSSVGFGRTLDTLRSQLWVELIGIYPPCGIERTGQDADCVRLAVPGSRPGDIVVTT